MHLLIHCWPLRSIRNQFKYISIISSQPESVTLVWFARLSRREYSSQNQTSGTIRFLESRWFIFISHTLVQLVRKKFYQVLEISIPVSYQCRLEWPVVTSIENWVRRGYSIRREQAFPFLTICTTPGNSSHKAFKSPSVSTTHPFCIRNRLSQSRFLLSRSLWTFRCLVQHQITVCLARTFDLRPLPDPSLIYLFLRKILKKIISAFLQRVGLFSRDLSVVRMQLQMCSGSCCLSQMLAAKFVQDNLRRSKISDGGIYSSKEICAQ